MEETRGSNLELVESKKSIRKLRNKEKKCEKISKNLEKLDRAMKKENLRL